MTKIAGGDAKRVAPILILTALILAGVLAECGSSASGNSTSSAAERHPEVGALKQDGMALTVWTVYWDTQRTIRNILT